MNSADYHNMDPNICPLCGNPNHCIMAISDNHPDEPCWCKSEIFSQKLLDKMPDSATNRACICRKCLKQYST